MGGDQVVLVERSWRLGAEARHDWGWVFTSFVEWVVVDREADELHAVVCGED